jgi:hypothetical protein
MYHAYLKLMAQLSEHNHAVIVIEDREIHIEKDSWRLTTKIFNGDGSLPVSVKECVSAARLLRWPERIELKIEEGSVYLIQQVLPLTHFQTFKSYILPFLDLAQEWQEIIEEFSGAAI